MDVMPRRPCEPRHMLVKGVSHRYKRRSSIATSCLSDNLDCRPAVNMKFNVLNRAEGDGNEKAKQNGSTFSIDVVECLRRRLATSRCKGFVHATCNSANECKRRSQLHHKSDGPSSSMFATSRCTAICIDMKDMLRANFSRVDALTHASCNLGKRMPWQRVIRWQQEQRLPPFLQIHR